METQDTEVFGPPPSPDESPVTAPAPHRSPLRRSMNDKMLGGVGSGIGHRYGIDPAIPRVIFVVAILAAGVGLFAYLALWLLIPADTKATSSPVTNSLWRLVLGVLLALGGVAALLGWMPWLVWVGVGGVAVWLYIHYRSGIPANNNRTANAPGTVDAPVDPDPASTSATGFAYGGTGESAAYPPNYPPTPGTFGVPSRPPKERSYLGLVTILVTLMVAGLLGAAIGAGLMQITAAALLVRFGNLETIIAAAQDPSSEITPGLRRKLLESREYLKRADPVVRLEHDVPIPRKRPILPSSPHNQARLGELTEAYSLGTPVSRLETALGWD